MTQRPVHPAASRRLQTFIVVGTLTALGPAAMDFYLPGLPALASDLKVSASAAQLTLTTYLVGLSVGQLVAGPLSDVFGRRRPLVAGMAVFTLASLACTAAPGITALTVARFLEGATAAFGIVISRAVVRDVTTGADAARYLSRLMLIVGLGPILAPILGGQLLRITSWRGVFLAVAGIGAALAMTSARMLPETLPQQHRRHGGIAGTLRDISFLMRTRRFLPLLIVSSIGSGAVLAYIAGSSFVLENVYGASPQTYSFLFALNAVFLVLGAQVNARLVRSRSVRGLLLFGTAALALSASTLLVVVLLPTSSLLAIVPPLSLLMLSWSFIQSNAIALALTPFPELAGTASALLGASQFAFGGLVAPIVGVAGNDNALPMALVVLVSAAIAGLAVRHAPQIAEELADARPTEEIRELAQLAQVEVS